METTSIFRDVDAQFPHNVSWPRIALGMRVPVSQCKRWHQWKTFKGVPISKSKKKRWFFLEKNFGVIHVVCFTVNSDSLLVWFCHELCSNFDNETRCYNNVDANRTVTDTIELWFHPQWKKGWLRPQFLRHNKSYAGTPCLVSICTASITLALEENPKRTSSISHHTFCPRSLPWVNAALRMRQTEVAKSVFAVVF